MKLSIKNAVGKLIPFYCAVAVSVENHTNPLEITVGCNGVTVTAFTILF